MSPLSARRRGPRRFASSGLVALEPPDRAAEAGAAEAGGSEVGVAEVEVSLVEPEGSPEQTGASARVSLSSQSSQLDEQPSRDSAPVYGGHQTRVLQMRRAPNLNPNPNPNPNPTLTLTLTLTPICQAGTLLELERGALPGSRRSAPFGAAGEAITARN